ncbi:proto-oncogene tyrosine-protein kinase receptor Ret-like [Strongylocentrotus purpuratus]|uniref:Protein kinase domain-containing protein n=1 Tax=Strongylocentrotus purpuratus TaxID=7668 RepID=A0A7M7PRJ6_STRPU|nr:proto-oncogene tyrosine-protein kinase receptor Ret-like [Strongylocentrotus purpuratus]
MGDQPGTHQSGRCPRGGGLWSGPEGAGGRAYLESPVLLSAIVPREATHGEHTVVAVKMLHKFAEDTQKQEFLREIELMKELGYHPNVVSLLGCCTIQDPICLLVEHCYYGDLLHFLRNRRPQMFDQFKTGRAPRTPSKDALRPLDLLSFARQIAMGMEYISQKGFVHRDLAARNVMVADDKNVKIGDFGLTRYVYDDKVYVNRRGGKLPVKWMSLEAIYDQIFTTKGDVWSYGVVLFEIVTLGAAPYPGISNKDMPKLLKGGYRMEKPDNCSPQIFSLMESTWCDDPELRPGFTEIRNKLEEMMEENVCYMEFDAEKQQCYCYEDSSSDDDSEDLNVEESPMLEPTNQDTAQNSLLATPMLKIPTGAVLQSRSTQNLSAVSPCKRMTPVSLSLNSLNHQKQIPPSWIPRDLVPFGRNFDNRAYYAGQPRADDGITHSALQIQEAQQDMNLYSGIAGSLENMHNNQENPVLAELNLECPHPDSLRLYNNESEKDKSSESVESSIDSCLCEDISDEERHHMIKEFTRSDTFDTSDLSPDTGKYPSLIALKRFTAEGKVLISPTSLDSGVSCDMTTGRLLLEGCRETDLCSDEDLSV